MIRYGLAVLLAGHGVAHLVGFVASWQLAALPELPYRTRVLAGRVEVGDIGTRVMGALWLLAALAFLTAAGAAVTQAGWMARFALCTVVVSMVLCVLGWPDARAGFWVNAGLALVLLFGWRYHLAAIVL